MKYAVIIPEGAGDEPVEELGGRTALEAAELPALDRLAAAGRIGTARTMPAEDRPAAQAGLLSVLGYDPARFALARGPLEALGRGLRLGPDDQAFRCDLVTLIDGYLRDATAGCISTAEARPLVEALNSGALDSSMRIHAGGSYRHLLVWTAAGPLPKLVTTPPELALDELADKCLPRGAGAGPLRRAVRCSQGVLAEHDVNVVRRDLGENPATSIWPWGQGELSELPAFGARFGLRLAVITGVDVLRGIARLIGAELVPLATATGLPGTDYAAKGRAALAALESHDLVCVHVQAPSEASRLGDALGKRRALEAIDRQIVAPLVQRLEAEPPWRVLVMPGHAALVAGRRETARPTIFVMAGSGIESNRGEAFDEASAATGELHVERACDLMEYFLRR